jgi:hypothetical protein
LGFGRFEEADYIFDFDAFLNQKMRLLYIVPNINNEGGVARVLSVKTNYWIEKIRI